MSHKILASLMFGAAMTLSSGAFADTMVGGKTVTDADLPAVQTQCNALAGQAVTADANAATNTDQKKDANGNTADAASTNSDQATGVDAATTSSIDLSLLTLDQCKEAGLVK